MNSFLEEILNADIQDNHLPCPEREYRFDEKRKWRFDFAWPVKKLAAEVEGGTKGQGRHNSPEGFEDDCEKYNNAAMQGWCVLRFTGDMVRNGVAIKVIATALNLSRAV